MTWIETGFVFRLARYQNKKKKHKNLVLNYPFKEF
jgi:hypothetical protein